MDFQVALSILNLPATVALEDAKKVFKQLCLEMHPDKTKQPAPEIAEKVSVNSII